MKKYLLIIVGLLIHFSVSAQTITATTFYVTPPTTGCNGIWAIDATTWPCSCTCTYSVTPFGCLNSGWPACDSIYADTVYMKLCSVPCNIIAATFSGSVVICGTPPLLTTGIIQQSVPEIKTDFNSERILTIQNLIASEIVEIYDITGRKIQTQKCFETSTQIDFNSFSRQIYVLIIRNKAHEIVFRKKIA